ncbi:tRNA 5-hydroxyuridine modification protein YegQ [Escherichia coli]|nr:tRNA 5-hydroxyuridine modification protein YegQ [Escherichia coli]
MRYAFAYGADAVYAGQPRYSLRVRNNEFNHENLQLGINEAHALGKKFYVVVNIAPHNAKLKTFIRDLKPVVEMGPDALIMSDPGLIMLVREHFPEMPIHLSVQANAVNWATVKFWQQMGLTRVIPSLASCRWMRLKRSAIRCRIWRSRFSFTARCAWPTPGRRLLSGSINKRDPNQGTCTNACRWEYNVQEGKEDDVGNIVRCRGTEPIPVQNVELTLGIGAPTDKVFMIEEAQRPGEYMTAFEDEHGTYIMNSKDLRAIAHVERLTKMGVHSLKIEGRTKSFYYCARTAQVYRKVIEDDAAAGNRSMSVRWKLWKVWRIVAIPKVSLRRHTHDDYQNYEYGYSVSERQQFVGEFTGERNGPLAAVAVKNKFSVGDSLELMTPQGNVNFTLEHMENGKGETMPVAPGDGYTVWLPVPDDLPLQYALLMRNFTGQTTRNPHGN